MMRQQKPLPVRLLAFCACALLAFAPALVAAAQTPPAAQNTPTEPRREQLLNGLPVLLAYRPGAPQVLLKLRLQSGAAFDLAGKEGLMALLGDILFPDPSTRDFVAEELGGLLEVTTDYDHIDVTIAGRATEFERLAELLRNAVVSPRIVAEDFTRLRDERARAARAAQLAPAAQADRAVAARLYGVHPYGRLVGGTPESLARVERADLLLARDRFLTADNARLVVIGGVEPQRALRAFRQFLGGWRKSETIVPATFRQPLPPAAPTLLVDQPGTETVEVRLATRGLARTERDHVAAALVAALARARWQAALGASKAEQLAVRHEAHALAGLWQMSARVRPEGAAAMLEAARATLHTLVTTPPTPAELEEARRVAAAVYVGDKRPEVALADQWLDAESYGAAAADEMRTLYELTPADVQRVATRLFRDAPLATVATGPLAALRTELARLSNGVEVAGAPAQAAPTPPPARRP